MNKLTTTTALVALISGSMAAADGHLLYAPGEGVFSWDALDEFAAANDLSGQTLNITGPATGIDKTRHENLFAYFEEATGATVNYSGSDSFEQDVVIATEAGSPPDLAIFPQPGLVADLAKKGSVLPLSADVGQFVLDNYSAGSSWVDLASFEDSAGETQLYGLFFSTDVKSLVWYVPEQFEESGYDVPETMEQLKELTDQIVADGGTPWCIGLGSGAATGWPATDWVEDMMLRTASPEKYDQWVTNELPFDSPEVIRAIEEYGYFVNNDDYVNGGAAAVANTDFRDSPAGLFQFPPECYMHRQASFIPQFFPEGVEIGVDVVPFYFPAYEGEDLGKPVLGSGAMWSIMSENPVANAMIDFLKTPFAHEVFMAQGNFLTPHTGADPAAYPNDTQRSLGEILTSATTFRFDGSDLMPGEIGTAAFWTGMVDYTTGESAESVAAGIQQNWDQLK